MMFNIFKEIGSTSVSSQTSRQNAQDFTEKLLESIMILKDVHSKANTNVKAVQLTSTDTIIQTAGNEINGNMVSFKMAFNHSSPTPYAVEITTKEIK